MNDQLKKLHTGSGYRYFTGMLKRLSCYGLLLGTLVSCAKDAGKVQIGNTGLINPNEQSDLPVVAASPAGDVVGKVTVGYQGWFGATGDGSPLNSWQHMNLESWPDVSEYTNTYTGTTFPQAGVAQPAYTGNLGNGQPAKMLSSWSSQTVAKHMEWMQQYGIDCVALQRFGSYLPAGAKKNFFDQVVARARNSAETYGRKFYIMYDCSSDTPCETDWTNSMQQHTSSSAYAKQNGKPVVCFWGVGKSGRGTTAQWVAKINWFKAQGCYVIGGTMGDFTTDVADAPAYQACDMIMAWYVGKTANFQSSYTNDLAWCNANSKDYQADIYPGTAFYNTNGSSSPKNQIKRMHGDFMWSQFAAAKNSNIKSVYISMFDELNEATQIMKTAENASQIPAGKYFLTLDADGVEVSSDFYLRLTNDGGKMIKGTTPYSASHPTSHTITGSIGTVANGTYKIINRNSSLALEAQSQGTTDGTPIQQWTYNGGNHQRWIVTNLGSGQYKILGVQSGKSLDLNGNNNIDGAKLQLYTPGTGNNQKFIITTTSSGYYNIKVVHSNKTIEVATNSSATGALIQQWTSTGGNNQQWAFQAP